tara:strand:- start:94 stop:432 length:339 start_codon:yes stop_codon:yes gene_type:complete
MDKIIISDDKGQEHQFTKIRDLVAYANSFEMSWLPDNFTWRVMVDEKIPSKEVITQEQADKIVQVILSAFKDGVADAILEGHRSETHEQMHYHKQGYDFGLTMYSELNELDK